jgi:antirestriction protein
MPDYGIYAACLASYNAGILHGIWVDSTLDPDNQYAQINAMLKASTIPNAEEWDIHDTCGFPYNHRPRSLQDAHELANFLETEEDAGFAALQVFDSLDAAQEALDHYAGHFTDLADYAYQLAEESGYLDALEDSPLLNHINFAAYGEELEYNGDIVTHEDQSGIYVFSAA